MPITNRDKHLLEYFPKDILIELDESQKNVLYDEFSNTELRVLGTQDLETVKAQSNRHLEAEFGRRLTHIKEEEYPLLKSWYQEVSKTLHEIICSKCGALIGLEVDTIDDNINPNHIEGKFVVAVGDNMFSYRPRLDGVMGYQCANVVPVTDEDKEAIKAEIDAAKEVRRAELTKEITERFAEDYKTGRESQINYYLDNPDYKKLDTRKKAEKAVDEILDEPNEETVQKAVEVNIKNEFPPYSIADKVYCGNDTRWSQIEIENIPEDHVMTSLTEQDIVKVKQEMNITNYEPEVTKTKQGYKVESFELREVKS